MNTDRVPVPSNKKGSEKDWIIRSRMRQKERRGFRSGGARVPSGGPKSRWWDRAWRWDRRRGWRWWGSLWCSTGAPSLPTCETVQEPLGSCWIGIPLVAPRALSYSTCLTLLLPHRLECAWMGATSAGSCWRRCSWPSGEPFLCLCRFGCGCGCGLPQRERERERGVALLCFLLLLSLFRGLLWPNLLNRPSPSVFIDDVCIFVM